MREAGHCCVASTCHDGLAGPQRLKYQLQLPDCCCRLFSAGHVGLQDHFQKANPYQMRGRVSLSEQQISKAEVLGKPCTTKKFSKWVLASDLLFSFPSLFDFWLWFISFKVCLGYQAVGSVSRRLRLSRFRGGLLEKPKVIAVQGLLSNLLCQYQRWYSDLRLSGSRACVLSWFG